MPFEMPFVPEEVPNSPIAEEDFLDACKYACKYVLIALFVLQMLLLLHVPQRPRRRQRHAVRGAGNRIVATIGRLVGFRRWLLGPQEPQELQQLLQTRRELYAARRELYEARQRLDDARQRLDELRQEINEIRQELAKQLDEEQLDEEKLEEKLEENAKYQELIMFRQQLMVGIQVHVEWIQIQEHTVELIVEFIHRLEERQQLERERRQQQQQQQQQHAAPSRSYKIGEMRAVVGLSSFMIFSIVLTLLIFKYREKQLQSRGNTKCD